MCQLSVYLLIRNVKVYLCCAVQDAIISHHVIMNKYKQYIIIDSNAHFFNSFPVINSMIFTTRTLKLPYFVRFRSIVPFIPIVNNPQ